MNPESRASLHIESKEKPNYQLAIIVHRHGPKASMSGPLSSEGKDATEEYFTQAYEGIALDAYAPEGIDLEHSPIGRTTETADIYADTLTKYNNAKFKSRTADERLSEGDISHYENLIREYGGKGGKWLKGWLEAKDRPVPTVKTGSEAASDFTEWLLDKVHNGQEQGGDQQVDAFSHAPVMAAFFLKLEQELNTKILPEDWQESNIFENSLNYLNYANFYTDSKNPNTLIVNFLGNKIEVPLDTLEKIVTENRFMASSLKDVTAESTFSWISKENLEHKTRREFAGFEITDAIDGGMDTSREVSLVKIKAVGQYPQHVHKESNAYFIITAGEAILLSGKEKRPIKAGDKIKIPKGLPHGFELKEGEGLEFISIQSPPIRNSETGAENLELTDMV